MNSKNYDFFYTKDFISNRRLKGIKRIRSQGQDMNSIPSSDVDNMAITQCGHPDGVRVPPDSLSRSPQYGPIWEVIEGGQPGRKTRDCPL